MLLELVLAVAAAFASSPPAVADGPPLTDRFPSELPRPEILARWELIHGRSDSNGLRVAYRFYVDPARPALYRVTQYRVSPETEKLIWNVHPGRAPLECYELLPEGWSRLDPTSHRYRMEMATAIRIYNLHRSLAYRPEP